MRQYRTTDEIRFNMYKECVIQKWEKFIFGEWLNGNEHKNDLVEGSLLGTILNLLIDG
jgi:hypothetical protein